MKIKFGFWNKCTLRFKHKLIISTSVATVIIGGFSIAGYKYSLSRFNELLYGQTAVSLVIMASQLSDRLKTLVSLSSQTALSSSIQSNLFALATQDDLMARRRARSSVTEELYRYLDTDIICITILIDNDSPIACGLDSTPESASVLDAVKEQARNRYGAETWMQNGRGDGSILCVREIRKSGDPYFLKSLGYLVYRVDLESIVNKISPSYFLSSNLFMISDYRGNRIYPEDGDWEAFLASEGKSYSIKRVNGKEMFFTGSRLYDVSPTWDITVGVSYDSIYKPMLLTEFLTMAMMLGGIAISLVITGIVSQSINGRFQMLIEKMDRLKQGRFEVATTQPKLSGDELGLLNRYFDEMTLEFKKMIDESYVKQLTIAQTRLKLLQQQINPHFLFNTLESINWFAKRSGEENIRVMVESLGGFLRGNLDRQDDGLVTLSDEISVLESYLKIQKIRYGDMLEVVFDIEEGVKAVLIPRLSLQPLVENAITYSMEESLEGCKIAITAEKLTEDALISIENTGSEIDENILDKLRSKETIAMGHGIGLLSIDERVKLIFGQRYGLSFKCQPDRVTVRLLVPYSYKGDS
ncbi:MAG: sensor histidine kinase [Clostridiales bacterium]|jgi:two-component system sensor histidine kinase YesM|nr:sensor histidine kinase [Clostridiales bacterium]